MLNQFRPIIRKFIDPVAERIAIPADYITLLGFLVACASATMYASGSLLNGGLLLALSGFIDVLDGAVARSRYTPTRFGGFLDSTLDRFSDGIIIIGITAGGFTGALTGMLALHSALMVSYVRARAESEGIGCSVGIAERAERLIILLAGSITGYIYGPWYMSAAIIVLILLGYFTVLQRIIYGWKKMKT
ncbi:archaetidylinositol phosphate synthase [Methanothermobacter wolfeii]|uniref:Archaetidylinositol phosphate synthase n=1 Tax=Methanothermobacter wolfeii TaxID=145261 RepID=A0A9E7RTK6_METWO|nr:MULTISPECIES: archaetidylinositol phosphate synthase [Methanothermobacter]MDI6702900.1 archaetidylinositol phosphate synthase [Methanothermobacter wolfeii]MDI6841429.1 archaetidylinositol phosphate synthase [Methanothermobacter wolfeii]NLM02664.1 CDP-alcohol phosphatidyltransferase family protein [Methanothermobacter wolfeii]QHN05803.1 CDP-alcohol phosphatidyltransferase family protein [Methanothermobacter sp. THM-1]UXH31953.1 archaetidylinositol phosphate synthase [Methanothermobacter wolf